MQPSAFLEQLSEDIGIAHQLLELTNAEYQALAERDLAELERLLTAKQPLLALLSQHSGLRTETLAKLGLTADLSGLEAFAQQVPAQAEDMLALAAEFEQALQSCREANERNGRQIRVNQSSVASMLSILQNDGQSPSLYNSRGGSTKPFPQRPLSQA